MPAIVFGADYCHAGFLFGRYWLGISPYLWIAMNVLFVCSQNWMRSPTAALLYSLNTGIKTQSAGTDSDLSDSHLNWADKIFVMEKHHRHKIRKRRPDVYAKKEIHCLYLEDVYDYCAEDLVGALAHRLTLYLGPPNICPELISAFDRARESRRVLQEDCEPDDNEIFG